MKSKLLLCCLILLSTQAFSQEPNFGIKAGVNYSDVFGDLTEGINAKPSIEAGFFAEFPLRGKFSFHPELLYSSRRTSTFFTDYPTNSAGATGEGDLKLNQHNIIIPLITKYNFNEKVSLELGPQLGFLVSTSAKFNEIKNSFSEDVKFDIGPTLGIGYDPNENLKLQLRYFIGLSDFFRESASEEINGIKNNQFNSVISLSAGFVIFK